MKTLFVFLFSSVFVLNAFAGDLSKKATEAVETATEEATQEIDATYTEAEEKAEDAVESAKDAM